MAINICTIEDCERQNHSHGICLMHYKRLRKHGTTDKHVYQPKNRLCSHDGCDKKHDSHGYCSNHAGQVKRYGHVLSKEEKSEMRREIVLGNTFRRGKKSKLSEAKRKALKGVRTNTGRTHFRKGFTPWNKGKKGLTGAWNKGRVMTEEHKKILIAANKGRRPWNKIGDGVTSEDKLQRAKFNKTMGAQILKRDNYTCQVCDAYGVLLHVDHIKSWSKYPELRFDPDNCRALCRACHYYITFKKKMPVTSKWGLTSVTKKVG